MKKYIILLLVLFHLPAIFFAQKSNSSQNSDYFKTYAEIVREKEAYFQEQEKLYGDGILEGEGSEYRDFQRWKKFWGPRIAPNGSVQKYVQGFEREKSKYSNLNNELSTEKFGNIDPWKELGPWDKPNAGLGSIGGGDLGVGIIAAIAINKIDPNKLLANSRAGGLFYSSDKGLNWINAGSDKWFRSGCESAAFAPDNTTTWYAASNIGGSYYRSPIGSVGGVYRTTNSGSTWDIIADRSDFALNPVNGEATIIHKIIIDPKNASVGYIATNIGLFVSTNINNPNPNLVTWSSYSTPILSGTIEDMEFKTDNSPTSTLIVSYDNAGWNIATTTNQGANWTSLPLQPSHAGTNQIVIEVTEANSDLLYIIDRKGPGQLWIYNFTTTFWTGGAAGLGSPIGGGHAFGVSNFNTNIVYCAQGMNLYKSIDGGMSFPIYISTSNPTAHHVDIEDVVSFPASCAACSLEVLVSTHGGVNFSSDEIATLQTRSKGLGIAGITGGAAGAELNPEKIAMGLDHDGSVLSSGSYTPTWLPTWHTVNDGDGGCAMADYSNSNYIWTKHQNYPAYVSANGGIAGSYTVTNLPFNNQFQSTQVQNKILPAICYSMKSTNVGALKYEDLVRSDKRGIPGSTIEQISDFKSTHSLSDYYFLWGMFPSLKVANTMYVLQVNPATWNMHFYRNDNMLSSASTVVASWNEMTLPIPNSAGAIGLDASNPNIVYVAYSAYSWSTSKFYIADYTNPLTPSFYDVAGILGSGGLPNTTITSIVSEKGSNGGIYVATDIGIYYANNSTLDKFNPANCVWTLIGTDLPHIALTGLEINYTANKLRASTFGRGIWEHDLYCPAYTNLNLSGVQNTDAFHEAENEILSTQSQNASISMTYRAGTYVQLNPGFVSTPNTTNYFHAFIHGCSQPGNSPGLRAAKDEESDNVGDKLKNGPNQGDITIFPNPSSGQFNIEVGSLKNGTIEVLDLLGNKIKTVTLDGNTKYAIDLNNYTKGMYLVNIISEGKRYSRKIILE